MKNLNKFLDKFCKSNTDTGIKYCLKILRVLAKNPFLMIWLPSEEENKYYAKFRSESGADFIINLAFFGDYNSSGYIEYQFEILFCGNFRIMLSHTRKGINYDYDDDEKPPTTFVMNKWSDISLKYGHLIMTLYNKVAAQLQVVVAQNKLKNALKETLEALKMQMA